MSLRNFKFDHAFLCLGVSLLPSLGTHLVRLMSTSVRRAVPPTKFQGGTIFYSLLPSSLGHTRARDLGNISRLHLSSYLPCCCPLSFSTKLNYQSKHSKLFPSPEIYIPPAPALD
ncbi:hypothetical protein BDR04DRAFT_198878 [Suillus decipiens]|nr:hypothetical protein BDR04DRAFT_198878 [Suillus decipiens]